MKIRNISITEFLKIEGKVVVCFGAGKYAQGQKELLHSIDAEKGVIECFIDNNEKLWGKNLGESEWNIYPPEKIQEFERKYDRYIILITSIYYYEILEQLSTGNYVNATVYVLDIMKTYQGKLESLEQVFYYKRIIHPALVRYRQNLMEDGRYSDKEVEDAVHNKSRQLAKKVEEGALIIPRVVFMVTEKCSLHCKDCAALINRFEHPEHIPIDHILRDIDMFLENVDECINCQVTGGECFLYPNLDQVLERLLNSDKVLKVGIVTNGTILPDQKLMPLLKNPKLFVEMSDYGLLERQARFVAFLEMGGVHFRVISDQQWVDFGNMEYRGKDIGQLEREYGSCRDARMCKIIVNGKIHACERAARMELLGDKSSYNSKHDAKDLLRSKDYKKDILEEYLLPWADACNFCDLESGNARTIEAGIQSNETIYKSKYTFILRDELDKLRRGNQ